MGVRKFFTKNYGGSKFFMVKIWGSEFFPGENMGIRNFSGRKYEGPKFFPGNFGTYFFNQSDIANQFCKRIALYDGGELYLHHLRSKFIYLRILMTLLPYI